MYILTYLEVFEMIEGVLSLIGCNTACECGSACGCVIGCGCHSAYDMLIFPLARAAKGVFDGRRELPIFEEHQWRDRQSPFYCIRDLLLGRIRERVVAVTNAPARSKILDVATGTGKQAFAFAKRGYEVVGIDVSTEMLNVARKKNAYDTVTFKCADATNMPFENSHFDVAYVSFALHEMSPFTRGAVLREMARVSKPDGAIVVVDFALFEKRLYRSLLPYFKFCESEYFPGFSLPELEAELAALEIAVVKRTSLLGGIGRIVWGINQKTYTG